MKRFRVRVIGIGSVGLLFFLALGWLNLFYLPEKMRGFVLKEVKTRTSLQTELGRVSFHPLKGVALRSLTLRDPQEKSPIFQSQEVYVRPLWLPLLLKREFIASSVTFEKPVFSLIRLPDGRWNLEKFWKEKEGSPVPIPFTPKVSLVDGDILFTDQTSSSPFVKRIENLNARISVGLLAHLYFKGSFGLRQSSVRIRFQGRHALNNEAFSCEVDAERFSLSDLSPFSERSLSFMTSASGNLSLKVEGKKKGEETFTYEVNGNFNEATFQLPSLKEILKKAQGEFSFREDTLSLNNVRAFMGNTEVILEGKVFHFEDPELDLTFRSQIDIGTFLENMKLATLFQPVALKGPAELVSSVKGKASAPVLSGSLNAKDLFVKNIPSFGDIQNLKGTLTFTENSLESSSLVGQYLGFPFEAKGKVTDFQDPLIEAEVRFTHPLEALKKMPFFQTLPPNSRPTLEGLGQWNLVLKGPLRRLSQDHISGSCQLQDASLKAPLLPFPVEKIGGTLFLDAKGVSGKRLTGIYSGNSFELEGAIEEGEYPKIQFSLNTKTLQLSSHFTLQGKDLSPFSLQRQTPTSRLSLSGDVLNYEKPFLNVEGRWEGPIEELTKVKSLGGERIAQEKIGGYLHTTFALSGPTANPDEMALHGELSSPSLTYKTFGFRDLTSRYSYRQNSLSLSRFSGHLFGGSLVGDGTVHFSPERPYTAKLELTGARLHQVMQHFSPGKKKASGFLSGTLQIQGDSVHPSHMIGEGWVKVEEGNLFQLPILMGLTPVLRPMILTLYPELNDMIVFQEAYAHFTMRNQRIATENLILKGNRATLYGQGTVGLDQSLDFHIWVQFTDPNILARPTELSRLKNILVNEAGMLSGEVRVTGTLQDPQYKYIPLPLNRIQDILGETGGRLLERLFR